MSSDLIFSSSLPGEYREDLETLMFFNPQQHRVMPAIVESIEKYGTPTVIERDGLLRIHVEGLPGAQTLFAIEKSSRRARPVGVMVYMRTDPQTIVLLHIGVLEEYSVNGTHADTMLALDLMHRLRVIARTIKGIQQIVTMYGKGRPRIIPVRPKRKDTPGVHPKD